MGPFAERSRFSRLMVILAVLLFSAAPGAEAGINVQYPQSVGLGKPFLVRITAEDPLSGASLVWQGSTIPLDLVSWNGKTVAFALLGTYPGKVRPGKHVLKVCLADGGKETVHVLSVEVTPAMFPEDRLKLPEKMVSPPPGELERIRKESLMTAEALSAMTVRRSWSLPMQRPVEGRVTGPYGKRRILNGVPKSHHGGLDFRASQGTPVKAALPGKVILTGDHYFAGKSIYVDSGNGVISHYFHLNAVDVKEGDMVRAGQILGSSGMTGRATGPHLHFGLSLSGQLVDPEPLFTGDAVRLLEKSSFIRLSGKKGDSDA